ncbi:MAG: nuclear transport factor 2 family protein [Acidobacteria bacterium]|nr:nuclear transport factor 2 family protein [Acidobacteriota bacterium]
MRRTLLAVVVASLAASFTFGQTAEQEVRGLENERMKALVRHDTKALEPFFSDGYILTTFDGLVLDKASFLAGINPDDLTLEFTNYEDVRVRIYGETAVVTGKVTRKGRSRGRDISGEFRYTHVWVRLQGRWQLVANQEARIAG